MSVEDQARAFLAMLLCGAGTGAVNDLLAVLRRGTFLTIAADILLGLLLCGGVIYVSLMLCCEPIRLYTLLGVTAGWMIYARSLGTIVRGLTKIFTKMSRKFIK